MRDVLIDIGEEPSYLQSVGSLGNGKVICFTNRVKSKREYRCSVGNNMSSCFNDHTENKTEADMGGEAGIIGSSVLM